jgi:aspartyl-tRNA(Asn)/glutamyl-tRNA(Gln) amidotransferase subunit A
MLAMLRRSGVEIVDVDVPEAAERELIIPTLLPVDLLSVLGQTRYSASRHLMDPVVAARVSAGEKTTAATYAQSLRRHLQ